MIIRDLFAKCYESHWNKPRYVDSGWAQEVKNLYEKNIKAAFGDRDCRELSAKEIRKWHNDMASRPTAANRSLEVLSRIYTFAEEDEIVPLGSNPCRLVDSFTERKRSRYGTEEELKKIGDGLRDALKTHRREATFIYVVALTGARPKKLESAKWSQVQREGTHGVLRFDGKNSADSGESEVVILPGNALKLLESLPKRPDGLILGPTDYRPTWERIREKAGCPDLWLRDLRRTFASVGLSQGVGIDKIGELLNHRSAQTTKTYARLIPGARVVAAHQISKKIAVLLS